MGRRSFTPRECGELASLIVQGRLMRVLLAVALLVALYLGATQGKAAALLGLLVAAALWMARPKARPELWNKANDLTRRD